MTTLPLALSAAALVVLGGCSPAPSPNRTGPTRERVVRTAGSYDMALEINRREAVFVDSLELNAARAWAELPAVFGALELPVNEADGARLQLAAVAHRPRRIEGRRVSTFLDCGRSPAGGFHADAYLVRLWVTSRIVPEEEGSRVETAVRANAQPRGTGGEPLPCSSTGVLERRVAELLRARATGGRDG